MTTITPGGGRRLEARREYSVRQRTAGVTGGVTNSIRYAFGCGSREPVYFQVFYGDRNGLSVPNLRQFESKGMDGGTVLSLPGLGGSGSGFGR